MNPINIPCSVHFDVIIARIADPLKHIEANVLKRIDATRGFFARDIITTNADPFLFVHDGRVFLFFEEQGKVYTKGRIKMTSSADLVNWTEPRIILQEKWHLSYPFVFEAEGNIWMIPECWESGTVRLYSATDDSLCNWNFETALLEGERVLDSSVYRKNGLFYLHTTSIENGKNILRLYTSEHVKGPWREHPMSPVAESRDGGSLYENNGKLYRFAQREDVYYGDGLDLFEITEITPDVYKEILVKEKFIEKCHHYNIAKFQGKIIAARDQSFLSFMIFEFIRRVCHYIPILKNFE